VHIILLAGFGFVINSSEVLYFCSLKILTASDSHKNYLFVEGRRWRKAPSNPNVSTRVKRSVKRTTALWRYVPTNCYLDG